MFGSSPARLGLVFHLASGDVIISVWESEGVDGQATIQAFIRGAVITAQLLSLHLVCLGMLSQGAGVSVPLRAPGMDARIRFLLYVCLLVLGTIGGVGEGLVAAVELAAVGTFTSVCPHVDLQVFQSREGLGTPWEGAFVWFFSGVDPHVDQQLVACIERFAFSRAHLPHAREIVHLPFLDVGIFNVLNNLVQIKEFLPTSVPQTYSL